MFDRLRIIARRLIRAQLRMIVDVSKKDMVFLGRGRWLEDFIPLGRVTSMPYDTDAGILVRIVDAEMLSSRLTSDQRLFLVNGAGGVIARVGSFPHWGEAPFETMRRAAKADRVSYYAHFVQVDYDPYLRLIKMTLWNMPIRDTSAYHQCLDLINAAEVLLKQQREKASQAHSDEVGEEGKATAG